MRTRITLCSLLICGAIAFLGEAHAEIYPFDNEAWEINGQEVEHVEYLEQQALRLQGGSAILSGLALQDGVIEFDIAVSELRGFSGARFRAQDDSNFEHFYIRPHQSGNPDANQYTPVYNGVSAWQLYYGEGYAAPVEYRFDEWMHIKIVFQGKRAEIYIDSDVPNLFVNNLKRPIAAGAVGLDASPLAPAYFANFEASPLPEDYQFAAAPIATEAKENIVTGWHVSDAFDDALLENMNVLTAAFVAERSWTYLPAETTGITNLAAIQEGVLPDRDAVVARIVVWSNSEQIKGLRFGYSDDVSIYVNGVRMYGGSNLYTSRDYRYLGTIGLFDEVYLPLKPGENDVWFAVAEAFGGWGVMAQFEDMEGITVFSD